MLQTLSIRNFAIIDRLELEFGPGLNVLTGETGAGKSIIIGALNAILGGRAGADVVRAGAERASIDAVFDVSGSEPFRRMVETLGVEPEDGLLYLSREIGVNGKSVARVGGRPCAVGLLREIGEGLVDLHGQHEHQSLLSVPRHLEILDEWGGRELRDLRDEVGESFRRLLALESEREALLTDARERARMLDLYQFQVQEIAEAGLSAGEEDELRADSLRLANAQKLAESAGAAAAALTEDGGALEAIAAIARSLADSASLDDRLAPMAEALATAQLNLEETARDLARYHEAIEYDPERLQQIEERLDLLASLKRKYGETVEEVIAYGEEAAAKLEALSHSEERGKELDTRIAEASERLAELCGRLSARRRSCADELAVAVMSELADLAMEKTRFEAHIDAVAPGPTGADRVEFLIAPNPGEPLRPLARIASGGEISRVMLAIKSAMARQDPLPTMVFDEIDVGVGGRTASVLGEKLSALARAGQVLCITHLPQIAARACCHFYIEKREAAERVAVDVMRLSSDERVEELARMLGGARVTESARTHARELLSV